MYAFERGCTEPPLNLCCVAVAEQADEQIGQRSDPAFLFFLVAATYHARSLQVCISQMFLGCNILLTDHGTSSSFVLMAVLELKRGVRPMQAFSVLRLR